MLKTTKQIELLYEDIQKKLYYMVPEKFDELYLYTSVYLNEKGKPTGELYFYYIPKGFVRKNPISVYEIPQKFNLQESEYLKLVDILYSRFQMLYVEYSKVVVGKMWTNLTLKIKNNHFKVSFDYEDLLSSQYSSYERHILWRYYVLGISLARCTREEREIIKQYNSGVKILGKKDEYESNIYFGNIRNIVDFSNDEEQKQYIDYITEDNYEMVEQMNENMVNETLNFNKTPKEKLKDSTKLFKIKKKDEKVKQESFNASSYNINQNYYNYQNLNQRNSNNYNQIIKRFPNN